MGTKSLDRRVTEGKEKTRSCKSARPEATIVSHVRRKQARGRQERDGTLFHHHAGNEYEATLLRDEMRRFPMRRRRPLFTGAIQIQENIFSARSSYQASIVEWALGAGSL